MGHFAQGAEILRLGLGTPRLTLTASRNCGRLSKPAARAAAGFQSQPRVLRLAVKVSHNVAAAFAAPRGVPRQWDTGHSGSCPSSLIEMVYLQLLSGVI